MLSASPAQRSLKTENRKVTGSTPVGATSLKSRPYERALLPHQRRRLVLVARQNKVGSGSGADSGRTSNSENFVLMKIRSRPAVTFTRAPTRTSAFNQLVAVGRETPHLCTTFEIRQYGYSKSTAKRSAFAPDVTARISASMLSCSIWI
jgi:hypothetical protein